MTIYLLAGAERVGKTTFGKTLAKHLGIPHTAFADEIKQRAAKLYPSRYYDIYADNKSEETRNLLCAVSQKARIMYNDDDYFTKLALSRANKGLVISDLRYERELHYVQENVSNYKIIWIGHYNDKYDLHEIYRHIDLFLPKYGDLSAFSI